MMPLASLGLQRWDVVCHLGADALPGLWLSKSENASSFKDSP